MTMLIVRFVLLAGIVVVFPVWGEIMTRRLRAQAQAGDFDARKRGYIESVVVLWIVAIAAIAVIGVRATLTIATPEGWHFDRAIGWIIAIPIVAGVVAAMAAFFIVRAKQGASAPNPLAGLEWFLPVNRTQYWWWVALSLTAGITEEIIFRGFIVQSLLQPPLALSLIVAGIISCIAFGLNHTYQGALGVVSTTILGAVFLALFVVTGNLIVPIVLHAIIDLRALLMLPPRETLIAGASAAQSRSSVAPKR